MLPTPISIAYFLTVSKTACAVMLSPANLSPMMFCLLQTCRAARGRPTGGGARPQAGFAFARFPLSQSIFGTARSGQGRAVCARRSEPLTARTVLEHKAEGKGGGGLRGHPPGGDPGQRPAYLTARRLRGHKEFRPLHFKPPPARSSESPRTPICSSVFDR